ncbi:MAG TPA: cytochrome P450 [Ktedonobacteraceae bacterium]|nr:cytochrome P450 [Ktedonobacteraceae bacterium]
MSESAAPVVIKPSRRGSRPPGPRSLSPLSSVLAMQRDTMSFAVDLWHRYGDIVRFRFLFWPAFVLYHPDYVKRVLHDNHFNYNKDFFNLNAVRPIFGRGLFTNDGESWRHQRRIMQPSFHHKKLAGFGTMMTDATNSLLERWQRENIDGQPLDIPREMVRLTARIAGMALFNSDLSSDVDTVGRTFNDIGPLLMKYSNLPFPPLSVPTPSNRRLQAGLDTLNTVVYRIIDERRKRLDEEQGTDLLSMLLAARDEDTGEGMSNQQLRDEVFTLLVAGYETTAKALTWTWYALYRNPEVEERLHAELTGVLGERAPTVEQLDALPYTRMVIQETMRLYGPTFGTTRHAIAADEIGGYHIPANSVIFTCQYCTHRHPEFWENPEEFDPERFTPERSAGRPRFAYFPFGGGPRQCIGNSFAMMEAQLVLATVVQRFRLRLVPNHRVEPHIGLGVIAPRYGLPMTLEERS